MTAESLFASARYADGLEALKAEVRKAPTDVKLRLGLFQAFCIGGQWERALAQVDVAAGMDNECALLRQVAWFLVQCEQLRTDVFSGARSPLLLGEPEPWLAALVQSCQLLGKGEAAAAAKLRLQALDDAPASEGNVDGKAFAWIGDGDSRLGPVVEAMLAGKYYWIPFTAISHIVISPPQHLRDLVWIPAAFTWSNGGNAAGFIPCRYPGSEADPEDAIRFARRTEWTDLDGAGYLGRGQRMFYTDAGEHPLLDIRELSLEPGNG